MKSFVVIMLYFKSINYENLYKNEFSINYVTNTIVKFQIKHHIKKFEYVQVYIKFTTNKIKIKLITMNVFNHEN